MGAAGSHAAHHQSGYRPWHQIGTLMHADLVGVYSRQRIKLQVGGWHEESRSLRGRSLHHILKPNENPQT
jgi:hypothetical protein